MKIPKKNGSGSQDHEMIPLDLQQHHCLCPLGVSILDKADMLWMVHGRHIATDKQILYQYIKIRGFPFGGSTSGPVSLLLFVLFLYRAPTSGSVSFVFVFLDLSLFLVLCLVFLVFVFVQCYTPFLKKKK